MAPVFFRRVEELRRGYPELGVPPATTREIRRILRQDWRFSNQLISDIRGEITATRGVKSRIQSLAGPNKPSSRTIIKTHEAFATRWRYYGTAVLRGWVYDVEDEDEGVAYDIESGHWDGPWSEERVPVMFGDDRLLTGDLIRDMIASKGQMVARKGGRGSLPGVELRVYKVEIDSIRETEALLYRGGSRR